MAGPTTRIDPSVNPDVERTAGGDFATGAGPTHYGTSQLPLLADDDLVIESNSSTAHTVTLTVRGTIGSTFTRPLAQNVAMKIRGRGVASINLDAADANVTWMKGLAGTVEPLHPNLGGGASLAASVFGGDQGNYNPNATGSFLMAGLGTTWKMTPTKSGKVLLAIYGHDAPNAAGEISKKIAYGTGSAPAQNAAAVGTVVGGAQLTEETAVATSLLPFCIVVVVTGLTLGTAYWFDLQVEIVNAGDITHIGGVSAVELAN